MVVLSDCLRYSICIFIYRYIQGKLCFHHYCAAYDACEYPNILNPEGCILFAHYILIVIITQICIEHAKCQVYYVACVSEIKSILSIIFHSINGAVYFSLSIYLLLIVRTCALYFIFYHHHIQIGRSNHYIRHCLKTGHETMIWAVCLVTFLLEPRL